jgi:L-threonylcarbamoyladenylate synthase
MNIQSLKDPQLVELLDAGKVGVMPSDTIYGVMCRAADEQAVKRLYALKKREKKPGTIIAASVDQLVELGFKARYVKAVEQYWPNPLSVIIPTGFDLQYLHQGKMSLAVRIPKDAALLNVLIQTGPLMTSSANTPGDPPANTIEEAKKYFGDRVDFYVDGGDLAGRPPSTVIRIIDDAIEVVRQGAVKINEAGRIEE